MKLSGRVKFCGTQLDDLAPEIVIQGVDLGNSKENISAVDRLGGFGQRITGAHWQTLEASVTFGIDVPRTNLTRRMQIWDTVANWCANKAGWLSITFDGRETNTIAAPQGKALSVSNADYIAYMNKRMYADKVIMPSPGDMYDWTKEFTIIFRAYNIPFWQDEVVTSAASGTAASGTINMTIPGRIKTPVDITFQNKSGKTISSFKVWTKLSTITLTDISLGGSETITISHGTDGLMAIKKGSTSLYSKYTGSDDLLISPGKNYVKYEAERAGILTASVYGRYV